MCTCLPIILYPTSRILSYILVVSIYLSLSLANWSYKFHGVPVIQLSICNPCQELIHCSTLSSNRRVAVLQPGQQLGILGPSWDLGVQGSRVQRVGWRPWGPGPSPHPTAPRCGFQLSGQALPVVAAGEELIQTLPPGGCTRTTSTLTSSLHQTKLIMGRLCQCRGLQKPPKNRKLQWPLHCLLGRLEGATRLLRRRSGISCLTMAYTSRCRCVMGGFLIKEEICVVDQFTRKLFLVIFGQLSQRSRTAVYMSDLWNWPPVYCLSRIVLFDWTDRTNASMPSSLAKPHPALEVQLTQAWPTSWLVRKCGPTCKIFLTGHQLANSVLNRSGGDSYLP